MSTRMLASGLSICAPMPHQRWGPRMIPHMKNQRFFLRGPQFAPSPLVSMRSYCGCINGQIDRASPSTTDLFRRRNYAPLSLVAIRACSSPCAALRRAARLSRGCSSSRRENAETFASLLVPAELSQSSLIFTPRGYKRTRAPHRRYSDCYAKRQSRHSSARAGFSVSTVRRSIMLMRDTSFFQEAES